VIQAPESPEDRGTDIRGQTLQLHKYPEGSVMAVTGDLAEVQMDKPHHLWPGGQHRSEREQGLGERTRPHAHAQQRQLQGRQAG